MADHEEANASTQNTQTTEFTLPDSHELDPIECSIFDFPIYPVGEDVFLNYDGTEDGGVTTGVENDIEVDPITDPSVGHVGAPIVNDPWHPREALSDSTITTEGRYLSAFIGSWND